MRSRSKYFECDILFILVSDKDFTFANLKKIECFRNVALFDNFFFWLDWYDMDAVEDHLGEIWLKFNEFFEDFVAFYDWRKDFLCDG